jgi:predicted  nucleic acid-binding Zn-ribbon protein
MVTREQELDQLKDQAKYFESALEEIGKRIKDLDSKPE